MTIPKVFVPGERLFASDLNDNFGYIDTAIGNIGPDYTLLEFAAAAESGGDITLDVDDGARLSFSRSMGANETLLAPTNMPEGSVINFLVDPINTGTSAPTVVSRATGGSSTTDIVDHVITFPSGVQVGELLLVVFSVDGAPVTGVSSGQNWVKLGQASNGAVVTGAIFYKIADGVGDNLTIATGTAEQSTHVSFRISGVKIPGGIAGANANGDSTNSNPPSATLPTTGTRGRLWIATRSGDAQVVATVAPSGYTDLQTQAAAGSNGASTNTAELTTTGSTNTEDPGTFSSTTEQWVSWTIGIDSTGAHILGFGSGFQTPFPIVSQESLIQIQKITSSRFVANKAWG